MLPRPMADRPLPYRVIAVVNPWPALACGRHRDDAKYLLRDKRIDRPGEIVLRRRVVSRIALVLCAAGLAVAVAGCKNSLQVVRGHQRRRLVLQAGGHIRQARLGESRRPTTGMSNSIRSGPVAPEDLVGADGRCGAPVAEAAPAPRGERRPRRQRPRRPTGRSAPSPAISPARRCRRPPRSRPIPTPACRSSRRALPRSWAASRSA